MKKLNREWVKSAVIIFLAVMLLLTFFSNTILNFTLPEVTTAQPHSGTITNAIRENATVQSMGSYNIEVETARQILAVYVREGDEVAQGDQLFLLEAGENPLVEQLNQLQLNYQKALLDLAGSDFAMQNETIRQAREDLTRAEAERAALGTAEMTETAAQLRVDEATAHLAVLSNQLTHLETELLYIDTLDSRSTRIGQWIIAYDQALADFVLHMGMTYDEFVAENPGTSNQWTQAVEQAETTMRNQAATQRVTVVSDISAQAALVSAAEVALTTAQNTLARIQRINQADDAVRAAQRTLNAAVISLATEQQASAVLGAQRLLDIQAMERDIADLEARILQQDGSLEGGDTVITARYAGLIVNLTAVAGQSTSPGIPLARIEVAQMGHVAEVTVDARQAMEMRPGTPVDVSSMNWFASITGRIASIRPDPENPANRRIVSVEMEGDVFTGEQVGITIPISAARFDFIVPRSALSRDATDPHVYILHERRSPLGTRYTAMRVDVVVEAEDETHVAIRGIDRSANVIIRSSAPLSDRDAVRLATD